MTNDRATHKAHSIIAAVFARLEGMMFPPDVRNFQGGYKFCLPAAELPASGSKGR